MYAHEQLGIQRRNISSRSDRYPRAGVTAAPQVVASARCQLRRDILVAVAAGLSGVIVSPPCLPTRNVTRPWPAGDLLSPFTTPP